MPGFVPGIHVLICRCNQDVDGRDKPGHDDSQMALIKGSQLPEQQQDQQDHDYEAEAATAVIAGAVERSAADAAETAEQGDYENDKDDCSD
jgi:hypothetical protein